MKKLALLLMLALCSPGCFSKVSDEGKVIAKFDGKTITDKEFSRKINLLPKDVKDYARTHRKDFLEDMISEHYLLKEATRRSLEKNDEVADLIDVARKKIIVAKLIETEVDKKIFLDPSEAETYYNEKKDEFMTPLTLRASHILVKTESVAVSLRAEIEAGGDFEDLARKNSLDTTAMRGGDLGFFQKGKFLKEFEDAVFSMKKGEIAGPVKTQFGYHLIKLTDRLDPTLRDFNSVKEAIEKRLMHLKRSRTFRLFVQALKKNETYNVDETVLESVVIDS